MGKGNIRNSICSCGSGKKYKKCCMLKENNDLFAWRSGGGRFDIGSEEDQGISAFVKVDGKFLCITRKNIHSIIMADTIDPKKTNPDIRHSQQHILQYGSDSPFVGRTLQQANLLFIEHSLPKNINIEKGLSISFSFLNEIISLNDLKEKYNTEEILKNKNFQAKPAKDGSIHIPSITSLEQVTKIFISNADHTIRLLIELVQLFYPEIKNKGWEESLYEKLKKEQGETADVSEFIKSFKYSTSIIRKIRNSIEHPDKESLLTIENYRVTPQNILKNPSMFFQGKDIKLNEVLISEFMNSTIENFIIIFEVLMAYLCNIHAEPFADEKRIVIETPVEQRQVNEKHVKFRYDILWTS